MELKVMTLDGKAAGSVELPDAIFGLEPRPDILQRCVAGSSPSASAAPTRSRTAPRSTAPARRCIAQKGTGSARHGSGPGQPVPRRRPLVRAGRAQPRDRSAEEGARARAQARACPPRPRTAASSCSTRPTVEGRQDQGAAEAFRASSASTNALIIDGAEVDAEFRAGRAQHPEYRRAAGAGHQRLRHSAAAQAGADQGRARSVGGALQMSTTDPRHYDVIIVAGHHREGDDRLGAQPGDVQGRAQRDQAADQGGGREAVRRQGQERQHAGPQGQGQGLQAARVGAQSPTSSARS